MIVGRYQRKWDVRHQSHGTYNVYVRILTFNLSLHVSVALVPTVVLSSKFTSFSSNLEYCKLLWKTATNLS